MFVSASVASYGTASPGRSLSLNARAEDATLSLAVVAKSDVERANVSLCNRVAIVSEQDVDEGQGAALLAKALTDVNVFADVNLTVERNAQDLELSGAVADVMYRTGGGSTRVPVDCQALLLGDSLEPYLRAFALSNFTGEARNKVKTILFRSLRGSLGTSPNFMKQGASILPEGSYVVAPLVLDAPTVAFAKFAAARGVDAPDEATALAFDATMLLGLSLQRAGLDADVPTLRDALRGLRGGGRRVTFENGVSVLDAAASGEDIAYRGVTGSLEGEESFPDRDLGVFRREADGYSAPLRRIALSGLRL